MYRFIIVFVVCLAALFTLELVQPVKEAVIKVGFVFLMVVTVFALYNDISKILPG